MNCRIIQMFSVLLPFLMLPAQADTVDELAARVAEVERAFAATMAARDFDAFGSFLAEETIFFAGETPLRGKETVAEAWKGFFDGPEAPFAWAPETVVVLDSGNLALSSGPVTNPAGERFATFQSVWRLEEDGEWRIVFDKGSRYCEPPPVPAE